MLQSIKTIKIIKKLLLTSEFNRNVLLLTAGTTIAQSINILISPILTRLYTPEDYGNLALFVSITTIFGTIANGRYELAIMIPKDDEDAINVAAAGFIFNVIISTLCFFVILIFNKNIIKLLKAGTIAPWLYVAPLTVFFIGLFSILNYTNSRLKLYKDIAKANIFKSIAGSTTQIFLGILKAGVSGLIIGQIVSQIAANTKLLRNIKFTGLFIKIKKEKILEQSKRYINFPKYTMIAALLNTTSYQLTNILISLFYGQTKLGHYYLAFRILGMPTTFIGSAISQVYFQQASKERQETGKATKTFNDTIKKLGIIGLPIFIILFFIIEDLFCFVFGEEWREAGKYAQIMIPLFFIRFIVSTVSTLNSVFEKNEAGLFIQLIILSTTMIIFWLGSLLSMEFIKILKIMTCILVAEFICLYFYLLNLSKGNKNEKGN
jgi:O-antigen/teichoic acid export membrane protein